MCEWTTNRSPTGRKRISLSSSPVSRWIRREVGFSPHYLSLFLGLCLSVCLSVSVCTQSTPYVSLSIYLKSMIIPYHIIIHQNIEQVKNAMRLEEQGNGVTTTIILGQPKRKKRAHLLPTTSAGEPKKTQVGWGARARETWALAMGLLRYTYIPVTYISFIIIIIVFLLLLVLFFYFDFNFY